MKLKHVSIFILLVLAVFLSEYLRPSVYLAAKEPIGSLDKMIPKEFDSWSEVETQNLAILNPQAQEALDKLYSQMLNRTYRNEQGELIMLSISYGEIQGSELAVHYPEACYPAQGFEVRSNQETRLKTQFGDLPIRKLETGATSGRNEPVTYWTTIGNYATVSSFEKRLIELRYGLNGVIPDGLLFRVSSIENDSEKAFQLHAQFINAMLVEMQADTLFKVTGLTGALKKELLVSEETD